MRAVLGANGGVRRVYPWSLTLSGFVSECNQARTAFTVGSFYGWSGRSVPVHFNFDGMQAFSLSLALCVSLLRGTFSLGHFQSPSTRRVLAEPIFSKIVYMDGPSR